MLAPRPQRMLALSEMGTFATLAGLLQALCAPRTRSLIGRNQDGLPPRGSSRMKVTQIRLAGQGAWPALGLADLHPELTVLHGPPHTGKSTVAQLAAQLLYGKVESPWRLEFGQATPLVEGSLDIDCPQGSFVLRRHRDGSPSGRLTVASAAGAAVDGRTVRSMLGGLSPSLLAELLAVDFTAAPQPQRLLEGDFARQFTAALHHDAADATGGVCREHAAGAPAAVDRRRFDDLARRRDEVVRQIEQHLSSRRRDSAALEAELAQVETTLNNRRAQAEELAARLHAVETKLAELNARLRYYSLEVDAARVTVGDDEARREEFDRLDQESARVRQMLADLQAREAGVRRELAEVHPDGTADAVGNLAEQRATVGVLERLVDDLDAEVAGLARSHEPGRCIAADAHARMLPVAQMLRQQIYALCGQVTEQERSVRRVQLRAELRQLSRAQSDLSEQLEHLLARRETLAYESKLTARTTAALPQPPAAGHCQCERHDDFLRQADEWLPGRGGRSRLQDDAERQQSELEAQRRPLRESSDGVAREIASLTARWEQLQQDRTQAAGRASLDELRAELERLESEMNRALRTPSAGVTLPPGAYVPAATRRIWKASDALAQLTGGQLMQIRISREGRAATIVDREGRLLVVDDLSPQQNDQLHLAIVLALASSLVGRGVELPLILDEPFLRQDPAGAAAMAGVLAEFAREGRQLIVLTEDREAARRLETLGADVRDIDAARRGATPVAAIKPPVAPVEPTIRVVREPADAAPPKLRLAGQRTAATPDKPLYYLTVDASLADFPVLGNDTAMVFSSLGVRTVEDLLAADAADVARRLAHPAVTPEAVRLWQQHTSLMCFVPGVSLADAQVLAACDVTSPESLFSIDVRLLADAIGRFLTTERGRRFATSRERWSRDRVAQLQKHARRQRDRWQLLSPRYAWVERVVEPVTKKPKVVRALRRERAKPKPIVAKPQAARKANPAPLRYLLDRARPAADAPSIGPKLAERLAQVGVRTVADLLNANPDSTADELGDARVDAATISRWQAEARLACRVPELRSAGARLLVACGLTEPEQVARCSPAELETRVRNLCRTAAGKRILRGGPAPSAARVTSWIRHAAHMRPLEAA
jgi:hypothetical protein